MGYYGYHILPQGISIINDIKICMNSFTLTNSSKFNPCHNISDNILAINRKLRNISILPTPYEIKGGIRYLRGTNNLVSGEKSGLIAINEDGNKGHYTSITECSLALGFGRRTIKNCLSSSSKKKTGNTHKSYRFVYDV